MAKRAITIWWIIGSVVMFTGMFGSLLVSYSTDPGNFLNGHTGTSVALLALALTVMFIGVTFQLVAWIGALFNAHMLANRTWFNVLLWIGIVGIVTSPVVVGGLLFWALMLTYVVGGPDGKAAHAPTPIKFAPTN